MPFYICSLVELYLYFAIATIMDIKGKRKSLKVNLIDYLENHLSNRMQVTKDDMRMLYGDDIRDLDREVDVLPIAGWRASREEREAREEAPKSYSFASLDPEESAELEILLKEILTLS